MTVCRTWSVCIIAVALLGVLAVPGFGQGGGKISNAQSAMFENTASGTFLITGSEVWAYNTVTARTYFTNAWDGNPPTVGCTGGGPGGVNCAPSNKPATPVAPAADANKLNGKVGCNSCNFWDGNSLSLACGGPNSYTQDVTINGLNGFGNWKFTFTYNIGFASGGAGPFPTMTAWELQSSSTTDAQVTVDGFFAGQSTQKRSGGGNPGWSFKTSHTMTNSDGTSRLVNPQFEILDTNAVSVCGPNSITTELEAGVDYFYSRNAGFNGPLGQLIDGALVSVIQTGGKASPDGDTDNFAGNNSTNGERANITSAPSCSISAAGSYTLKVTGTLKGVEGAASLPVSITSSVCVSAGTCQVCP